MRKKSILTSFALVSVSAIALLASACGDDDADATSTATTTAASGSSATSHIVAIQFIDTIGLHGIDESINDEKTVPPTARTSVLKSAAVLRSTEWPESVSANADALADTMIEFAEVLNADPVDLAKAGELGAKVHDDAHDFSNDVWVILYEGAGVNTGEDSHGD